MISTTTTPTITTTAGTSIDEIGHGTWWLTSDVGTSSIQPLPPQPVGDMLTLMKTGNGEFVLSGANAQKLLMEYFEQAPEMWLRLMALKAEEKAND